MTMPEVSPDWFHGARRHSEELSEEQCWALLASQRTGRVAYAGEARVLVFPVHYIVQGEEIFLRTSAEGELGGGLPGHAASFQIDQVDQTLLSGWSVLASGRAEAVEDPDLLTVLWGRDMNEPWAEGIRNLFIRITPTEVTGRRVSVT